MPVREIFLLIKTMINASVKPSSTRPFHTSKKEMTKIMMGLSALKKWLVFLKCPGGQGLNLVEVTGVRRVGVKAADKMDGDNDLHVVKAFKDNLLFTVFRKYFLPMFCYKTANQDEKEYVV